MDPITIIVAALAAVGVLLVFVSLASGPDVNARLERYAASPANRQERKDLRESLATSTALANINRVVEKRDYGSNLARELARADIALKPSEFLAIRFGAVIGIPLLMIILSPLIGFLGSPIAWIGGVVLGFWLPKFWLGRRKSSRLKAFNSGLADTIMLLANSLRAGSSFLQSVEMVVREAQPPISTEFSRVIREVNLGLPLDDALSNLGRRMKSDDLDLMITAIAIQHQVGGNLAEILDTIAFTIRERVRIKGEIKTLTAQQRMSGYVVGFLPIGLCGLLFIIAPKFMEPMFLNPPSVLGLPLGVVILFIGGFFMFLGFMAIRRIVDIEV